MRLRSFAIAGLTACLAACASAPSGPPPSSNQPVPAPRGQKQNRSQPGRQEQGAGTSSGNPAVIALLNRAQAARNKGNFNASTDAVERAIDIDPGDPMLWNRLASLYLDQGNAAQAEAMARKSNSLLTDNNKLRAQNWRIIAQALRIQGNDAGAANAEKKARNAD